jgi:hypothetical protein
MNRTLLLALLAPTVLTACISDDVVFDTGPDDGLQPILCDTGPDPAPEITTTEDVLLRDCPTEPTLYTTPFEIFNDGNADLVVSDVYSTSPDWVVLGLTLPLVIPPLTGVTLQIEYDRVSCDGGAADLIIESNDDDEAQISRALSAQECAPLGSADPFWSARSSTDPELLDVYWSNGDGTFQSPQVIGTPTGSNLGGPVVGDFDGDDQLDIVVSGEDQGTSGFAMWLHTYDECWDTWSQSAVPNLPFRPRGGGDLDNDGDLDLYGTVGNNSSAAVAGHTALNDGLGDFTAVTNAFNPTAAFDYQTHLPYRLGDLNDDGCVDVAVWSYSHGGNATTTAWLYAGQCDGTFAAGATLASWNRQPLNGGDFWDLDGDGRDDLLLGPDDDQDSGQLFGRCGGATPGGFSMSSLDVNTSTESNGANRPGYGTARVYDWDGDGYGDVLLNWYNNGTWSNVQLDMVMGTGAGTCSGTWGSRTSVLAPGSGVTPSVPLD